MVAKTLLLIAGLSLWAQPTTPWIKPQSYTVATLPSPGVTYRLVFVTDASSSSTCSSGGGSNINLCRDTGVAWAIVSSGGGGGSGCVPSGSDNQIITDDGAGGCTSEAQWTIAASILTAGATGGLDAGSATYLKIPTSAGAAPTANGRISYDSTANKYKFGANTATKTIATEDGNIATATALATPRGIYGNNFDGTAALTQIIASTYGGTGNGFTKFTGPTTSEKTFMLPDSSETLLYAGGALGTPASGVATNLTGTASGLTAGAATALAADPTDCSSNQPAIGINASGTANCATLTATVVKAASGVLSAATAGTDYTSPSSTESFTNKTIDSEGTGNTITLPFLMTFIAANCQGTTAFTAFATPTANSPAAECVTGTNTNYGVLSFDAGTDESVQMHMPLPSDWTGNIDLDLRWRAAATSGNVIWAVQTICVADGETGDPAFNTASTVTDAAKGTTLQFNDASMTTITVTGCAAGEELMFKIYRDADAGGDTMTGDAQLIWARFKMRRAI